MSLIDSIIPSQINTKYFCTLFDSNYLIKGVAMLRSLATHMPDSRTFVLCMDEFTYEILQKLSVHNIELIHLYEIEKEELLAIKGQRTKGEYCWTLTPYLPHYLLSNKLFIDEITYLDADLFFYSNPAEIFKEIKDAAISIIEHRFSPHLLELEIKGKYCVEWVGFKRTPEGFACLKKWRSQCIEWCHHRLENDRFGDQKYLDTWPSEYQSLHVIRHEGAGIAPWNYENYKFTEDRNGRIFSNNSLLIFYHFHQFQIIDLNIYDRMSSVYSLYMPPPDLIYEPYESAITSTIKDIRLVCPRYSIGFKSSTKLKLQRLAQRSLSQGLKEKIKKYFPVV